MSSNLLQAILGETKEEIFFQSIYENYYYKNINSTLFKQIDPDEIWKLTKKKPYRVRHMKVIGSDHKRRKKYIKFTNKTIRKKKYCESVVLDAIHMHLDSIKEICNELGSILGVHCQVNSYYTPKSRQTFKLHHDSHDVFIIQLSGKKIWKIQSDEAPLVTKKCPQVQYEKDAESMVTTSLVPGQTLYIPRGQRHKAWTEESDSLHLTIGLYPYELSELMMKIIDMQTYKRKSLRKGIPLYSDDISMEDLYLQIQKELEKCLNFTSFSETIKAMKKKVGN